MPVSGNPTTPRVTRVDTVIDQIRAAIETGGLAAGDRLPGELEWSRRLQVSRPVVREAVSRLQSLGVLHVSPGRGHGMVVGGQDAVLSGARLLRAAMSISPKQMRQFNEFRAALEIYAARRAAEVATPEQVARLEQLCEGLDEPSPTSERAIEADFRFHRAIAEIIDNPLILHTLEVSQEIVKRSIRDARRRNRGQSVDSRGLHQRIVDCIRRRDPEAAMRTMAEHLHESGDELPPVPTATTRRKAARSRAPRRGSTRTASSAVKLAAVALVAVASLACLTIAAEPKSAKLAATLQQRLLAEEPADLAAAARAEGDPRRGAIVFHQPHLACTRCHVAGEGENQLGPDLARLPPDTTAEYLIESLLEPSKVIRRGFEATVIELNDGTALTGMLVEQNDQAIVVRDVGQNGQLREIPLADIAARETVTLSIMPTGQMNLLAGRHQFLDLLAYLIEIAEQGPERALALRPPESLYAPPPRAPDTAGAGPRVFRTLMPESGPGALAIGLAENLWACFDPQRGGVNYAWQGTLDLGPTVEQKINQPAIVSGELFYRDTTTGPLRVGSRDEPPRIRFLGYRLLPDGVAVRYRAHAVEVLEHLTAAPQGTGMVRRLQLTAPSATTVWLAPGAQTDSHIDVEGARREGEVWRIDLAEPTTVTLRIQASSEEP